MPPIPSALPGPDWPEPCRAFFEHWKKLRGDALMPTSESFLDAIPPAFVSNFYITDVTSLGSIVRYQGDELIRRWGADLTGQEMAAHRVPAMRRQLHDVMNMVAAFPCGYFAASRFVSSLQRPLDVYIIRLPLAAQTGRPYRTANFTSQYENLADKEYAEFGFETVHSAWFDIGAGVPAKPPEKMHF